MFRWRWGRRVGQAVVLAGVLLLLLIAARIHACACTGGPPQWRSIDSTVTP